jgi:lanosterol synthase
MRQWSNDRAYQLIVYEDENTGHQTLGPVSKAFNLVCRYAREGPDSDAFKMHLIKVENFLWMSKDGLMMTGTDGSQLWDLAFMAQAAVETGLANEDGNQKVMLGMLDWLDKAQMRDNPRWYEEGYRHRTKGAWPFSTPEQGYTVSDCAAEGLKAAIQLQSLPFVPKTINIERMRDCIDTILSMQNPNGGYASYELQRGSEMMELLNSAEVFGNIMVDYMYPE